jgi:phosphomannomutase
MESSRPAETLAGRLSHSPRVLKFGTSGRRGLIVDLTQLEIYINALAELEYLQSLPPGEGGIVRGDDFYFARDLRPSATGFIAEHQGRGGLAQAIVCAIADAGMRPVNLGRIPTPALTLYAVSKGNGSIMVTGSHIPADHNGYKANTSRGELLKHNEQPINRRVEEVRERLYNGSFATCLFDEHGRFKDGDRPLPPTEDEARDAYVGRYVQFAGEGSLAGLRLLFYQHSAVGRELLPEILERLGAEVILAGHSDEFVPIDTENIDAEQLATIQALADAAVAVHGAIDAVVSTDGDSDRPLVLGVENGKVRFYPGDFVGMVTAEYLGADAVVVPISCNDAIDRGSLAAVTEPKTRIGSPYVIAGMEAAVAKGRRAVCGWEANGGFLLGSDLVREGKPLKALPTRDAMLPILGVLLSAREKGVSIPQLFEALPRRFSRAALLKQFPRATALRIVQRFTPSDPAIRNILLEQDSLTATDDAGAKLSEPDSAALYKIRDDLAGFFSAARGFAPIQRLNYTDGVRILFANGDVAHLRPSGNADELRIYAVADTQTRAEEIAAAGVGEPDGILRSIERAVTAS